MAHVRMVPADRKKQMLESALVLAETYGLKAVTRVAVAAETGTTDALVNRYFGNKAGLRGEIIYEAVQRKNVTIIAKAMRDGFDLQGIPADLRAKAMKLQ